MKVLFLLKKNHDYSYNHHTAKSGLSNSALLTAESLHEKFDVEYKVSTVVDANSIDKELFHYKPDYCVIEALFVTPLKLQEIQSLHSGVIFIIRIHSKISFLASEGIALEWIKEYVNIDNTYLAFNNKETASDFNKIGIPAYYLPNIYYFNIYHEKCRPHKHEVVKIGCFGAIRPLKNQLFQAVAAIEYAKKNKVGMEFHINSGRPEQGGESVLKNIRNLFANTHYRLVEHTWYSRKEFLEVIKQMDIGLQLSFTESFNIVAADFVSQHTPIIVSEDIDWMPESLQSSSRSIPDVVSKIACVLKYKNMYIKRSLKALCKYNVASIEAWEDFLGI